ncbi:MAG: glycosyltransferase, partial [Roseiflexaceae bacterium]
MSQSQRRIIMPSDVFPPKCGGAGWSAHALALALQERGEHVTAVVPRVGQSALFHRYDVDDVPTINVAQPSMTTPLLRDIVRQYMVIPRLQRAIRQAMVNPHQTIIHAQHILAAQAAMPFRQFGAKVIITVRDHWPWDYQATGMQMMGDQRHWREMWQTLAARRATPQQRLLCGAYVWQMRQRAELLQHADMVIGVSKYMRDRLSKYLPRSRVVAVPNMVDCAAIAQITAQAPTIAHLPERFSLFVGKLERNKGAEMLPELILRIRPPAIVVAGPGP